LSACHIESGRSLAQERGHPVFALHMEFCFSLDVRFLFA
jgi:hypothetical protein